MANADLLRIRFITNRDDLGGDNDARFGGRVGAGLSVGAATVRLSESTDA